MKTKSLPITELEYSSKNFESILTDKFWLLVDIFPAKSKSESKLIRKSEISSKSKEGGFGDEGRKERHRETEEKKTEKEGKVKKNERKQK